MWHAINSIFAVYFFGNVLPIDLFIEYISFRKNKNDSKNENEARPAFRIKLDSFSSIYARYQLNIPNFSFLALPENLYI